MVGFIVALLKTGESAFNCYKIGIENECDRMWMNLSISGILLGVFAMYLGPPCDPNTSKRLHHVTPSVGNTANLTLLKAQASEKKVR